ncbi:MAG: hypothetical protein JNN30_19270 [Rhodanobacteraceae bacterium]|nr:hypothetical protein [Rhodanobacteraceae bacterium]
MRRHRRQNLLLAAALGVLVVITWLVVAREQAGLARLTTLDPAQITSLRVSAGATAARRFERRDGRWWMSEPYSLPAHADAVARLVAIASAPTRSRHARDRFDPARIGLSPPQALLELDALRLEFGTTEAIHGDRYVRTADDIALMPDRFSSWLLAPAESEVDHRLAEPLQKLAQVLVAGVARPELATAWERVTTSQVIAAEAIQGAGSAAIAVELVDVAGKRIGYTIRRRDDGRYLAIRSEPALAYPLEEHQMQLLLPASTDTVNPPR